MFGWDDAHNDYKAVQDDNQAELSHEVLAGGASFLAMHEFEKHQRAEGKEVDHGFAKEAIAAFAGAEVDRLAETKGADYIDREKAKREAKHRSEQLYDQQYGQEENYNPRRKEHHRKLQEEFGDQYGGGGNRGFDGGDQGYGGGQGGYGGGDQYGGGQGGYGGGDQYGGGQGGYGGDRY